MADDEDRVGPVRFLPGFMPNRLPETAPEPAPGFDPIAVAKCLLQ